MKDENNLPWNRIAGRDVFSLAKVAHQAAFNPFYMCSDPIVLQVMHLSSFHALVSFFYFFFPDIFLT